MIISHAAALPRPKQVTHVSSEYFENRPRRNLLYDNQRFFGRPGCARGKTKNYLPFNGEIFPSIHKALENDLRECVLREKLTDTEGKVEEGENGLKN